MSRSNTKDNSDSVEGRKAEMLRKKATSSKGRMNQPKGSMNPQHKQATKVARKEKNPDSKRESLKEMEF